MTNVRADLRDYLTRYFGYEELTLLCADHFPDLHRNIGGASQTSAMLAQRIIDYCEQHLLIKYLLDAVQRLRPQPFEATFIAAKLAATLAAFGVSQPMGILKLAPSILTADFGNLGAQLRETEQAGADLMHLDVMDGTFVPNISFGPAICSVVRQQVSLFCEAHLMIERPERYFADYVRAGMNRIIFHVEACKDISSAIAQLRTLNVQVGLAVNPLTPLSTLEEALPLIDLALIMSVHPGFGGQHYIPESTQRTQRLRAMLNASRSQAELEVDGGVNATTIREVRDAGASVVVVGSAVYNKQHSIAQGVNVLRLRSGQNG